MSPPILDRLPWFQRQAEVLAALNHPNVAAVYGLEKTSDLTALVMELVEGDELCGHIARGPIQLADALRIANRETDRSPRRSNRPGARSGARTRHRASRISRAAGAAGGQILFLASVSSL
jgi:hypothetical protein